MKKSLSTCMILAASFTLAASCMVQAESPERVTYESADGWSIAYLPGQMEMSEQDDAVNFVYAGSADAAGALSISYVEKKMPQEVLYEAAADIDDTLITRTEGMFAGTGAWAFGYIVTPETEDDLYKQFTGIEHNGGTLLFSITAENGDEEQIMPVSDALEGLMGSFEFTDHQPQEQFSYVPGTYCQEYTDTIDDQEVTVTYSVELASDHTGTLHLQDDVDIIWTSTEFITEDVAYQYTIEGDTLLVEFEDDAEWSSFDKVETEGDLADTDFAKYAGTYTSENQDTLTINEDGSVSISIIRLTQVDGTASGVSKGIIPITVTDASGNEMGLEFICDSKELVVTDSTWELLENGTTFLMDK